MENNMVESTLSSSIEGQSAEVEKLLAMVEEICVVRCEKCDVN